MPGNIGLIPSHICTHVQTCSLCQQRKGHNNECAGYQVPLPLAGPFQLVASDICGPFHETPRHNMYIVVLSDYFTR